MAVFWLGYRIWISFSRCHAKLSHTKYYSQANLSHIIISYLWVLAFLPGYKIRTWFSRCHAKLSRTKYYQTWQASLSNTIICFPTRCWHITLLSMAYLRKTMLDKACSVSMGCCNNGLCVMGLHFLCWFWTSHVLQRTFFYDSHITFRKHALIVNK